MLKKIWWHVKPFWYNTGMWQTDRRTDRIPISKCASTLLCWRAIKWTYRHCQNFLHFARLQRDLEFLNVNCGVIHHLTGRQKQNIKTRLEMFLSVGSVGSTTHSDCQLWHGTALEMTERAALDTRSIDTRLGRLTGILFHLICS